MDDKSPILFGWKPSEKHYWLSNFYPCTIYHEGLKFYHSEGFYQSMKNKNNKVAFEAVRRAEKPRKCKHIARSYTMNARQLELWDGGEKITAMKMALKLKFSNPEMKLKLISTGNQKLVEHTPFDFFWGDGYSDGKNMLGILLMELRDEIRREDLQDNEEDDASRQANGYIEGM
ncbi:hypothetical protein F4677DRAFT_458673 [Hypoxylon crocopeplum]|nr:hypothetical protein F4677DRAFT_458673 [Hypoxylon crocopeplum]